MVLLPLTVAVYVVFHKEVFKLFLKREYRSALALVPIIALQLLAKCRVPACMR